MIPVLPLDQNPSVQVQAFLDQLAHTGFLGEINADFAARLVAATDNSIYQILPAAVLYPRDQEDVRRILALAARPEFAAVRFSARGAGTGTNGQSLTEGVVIDLSRHMCRILELNLEQGFVRVEPGLIRDQLNEALRPHGVFFAPTLSPSNRATIGGMVNTDACGEGSRVYGRTSDHVLGLTCILADGTRLQTSALDGEELAEHKCRPGSEGEIYRCVDEIVTTNADLIRETFPKMRRFLTGYNLAHVYDADGRFHLDQLICGSEGSLAVVTEAVLRLTPLPRHHLLVATKYAGFEDALADAMALLESEPTAIETVDEKILELARKDAIYYKVKDYIADVGEHQVRTVNLVEYSGHDRAELDAKLERLQQAIAAGRSKAFGYYATSDASARAALWELRKKGVGLLGNMPGDRKPIAFVEDTAVPPENLAAYIREFRALLDHHGLDYAMYGHVDVGCLHVRPALDTRQERDVAMVRQLSDEVVALVRKYGGIMWAEHGKGFRSEYTPLFFGEVLYRELRRVKRAFDPGNKMNPGKVVTPLDSDEQLVRVEAPLKGQFDRQVAPADLAAFDPVFGCNGNGVCFNGEAHTVMCPSSKITRDRIHSPKGRAALLREWLRRLGSAEPSVYAVTGPVAVANKPALTHRGRAGLLRRWRNRLLDRNDYSHQVHDAMSGCLSCKACATQCPIHVDIPEYKAAFLDLYYTRYPRPLRDYLIAFLESNLPMQAQVPALVNGLTGLVPRALMRRLVGLVDPPKLARPGSAAIMRARGLSFAKPEHLKGLDPARTVLLLPDAFTFYYDPKSFWDCHDLLVRLGWQVAIMPFRANGKPMHIKGFLDAFRRQAEDNDRSYAPFAATGLPVVCVEPSIALTWRDEYVHILGREPKLKVHLVQEWLADQTAQLERLAIGKGGRYHLLGHCMERTAVMASGDLWRRIFSALGLELEALTTGCCGMAGTYGHEAEHVEESRGIFEMSWEKRIQALDPTRILVTGYSCRTQTKRFAGLNPPHPCTVLLHALGS